MNKDEKLIDLFSRRWDISHDWEPLVINEKSLKVLYRCKNCQATDEIAVYDIDDKEGHEQILNYFFPNCKTNEKKTT